MAIVLLSIAAHALVIMAVNISGPSMEEILAASAASRNCTGAGCDAEWVVSCESDAALVSSARLGLCSSPFRSGADAGACARDVLKRLEIDLVRCRAPSEEVAVALVDLAQIPAPKPLLPDVAPVDDIVAAQLIEKETAEKLEQAQKQAPPTPTGQVVEITRPKEEKAPDNARYVSEYDSSVEKQTVARGSTEKMVERPAEKALPPTGKENPAEPEAPRSEKIEPPRSTKEGPGEGTGEAPSTLSMRGRGESPSAAPTAAT